MKKLKNRVKNQGNWSLLYCEKLKNQCKLSKLFITLFELSITAFENCTKNCNFEFSRLKLKSNDFIFGIEKNFFEFSRLKFRCNFYRLWRKNFFSDSSRIFWKIIISMSSMKLSFGMKIHIRHFLLIFKHCVKSGILDSGSGFLRHEKWM